VIFSNIRIYYTLFDIFYTVYEKVVTRRCSGLEEVLLMKYYLLSGEKE
jgi:hypothetical protein